jgi:hypothetical protein
LLFSRNVDSTPFVLSFMIRSVMRSVKYTLPARSTVGPSVNASVVAISSSWPARDHDAANTATTHAPARRPSPLRYIAPNFTSAFL